MIELIVGDITTVRADAIVNAANSALAGGGGVDGAIHAAGGPSIMEETRQRYGGCATGDAVISEAGLLQARYVIHTVAPRYRGDPRDAELLRSAYASSLRLAKEHGLKSIAFPSLGTGAYRYPVNEAAPIALDTVQRHLCEETTLERVTFVLFKESDREVYAAALLHKGR